MKLFSFGSHFCYLFLIAFNCLGLAELSVAGSKAVSPKKNLETDLIRQTDRPHNYETPIEELNTLYTPNNKFFVRSHLPNSTEVVEKKWEISIQGEGFEKPFKLSLAKLKKEFTAVEVSAVSMCAGNRRSEFNPRVPGVQWGKGAIGNGLWRGVRLKEVLQRAGINPKTIEIAFNGADFPTLPGTPDFVKSIPIERAMDESTLLAYELNGAPLPKGNGFPVRLIVPGWVASYWVKEVVSIEALTKPSDSFWMKKAYRIEKGKFPTVEKGFASQEDEKSVPISSLLINSLITNLKDGAKLKSGSEFNVQGFAWDGGRGIQKVEVSIDAGKNWSLATLGEQPGKYSWRPFSFKFSPNKGSEYQVMARATNDAGENQPTSPVHNPSGYHNNAIQSIHVVGE